ncbi:hypothetical protein ABIC89_001016 [Variovorax boronicumulans]|uniref:hypothetical protein n=1 Tax=Variovorax boronicumulans TaxID=436515 RepID=UPI00339AEA06
MANERTAAEYEVREWMGENDVVLKTPAFRALIELVLAAQSAAALPPVAGEAVAHSVEEAAAWIAFEFGAGGDSEESKSAHRAAIVKAILQFSTIPAPAPVAVAGAIDARGQEAHVIEGVVKFMRSEPDGQQCTCCPEGGGHIFGRYIEWGAFDTRRPKHFGNDARVFVDSRITDFNDNEGRRVRLTVELLPVACEQGEPLRRLGEYLSRVLVDDQWATAERMILGACEASAALAQAASKQEGDDLSGCKPPMRHITGVSVELLRRAALTAVQADTKGGSSK